MLSSTSTAQPSISPLVPGQALSNPAGASLHACYVKNGLFGNFAVQLCGPYGLIDAANGSPHRVSSVCRSYVNPNGKALIAQIAVDLNNGLFIVTTGIGHHVLDSSIHFENNVFRLTSTPVPVHYPGKNGVIRIPLQNATHWMHPNGLVMFRVNLGIATGVFYQKLPPSASSSGESHSHSRAIASTSATTSERTDSDAACSSKFSTPDHESSPTTVSTGAISLSWRENLKKSETQLNRKGEQLCKFTDRDKSHGTYGRTFHIIFTWDLTHELFEISVEGRGYVEKMSVAMLSNTGSSYTGVNGKITVALSDLSAWAARSHIRLMIDLTVSDASQFFDANDRFWREQGDRMRRIFLALVTDDNSGRSPTGQATPADAALIQADQKPSSKGISVLAAPSNDREPLTQRQNEQPSNRQLAPSPSLSPSISPRGKSPAAGGLKRSRLAANFSKLNSGTSRELTPLGEICSTSNIRESSVANDVGRSHLPTNETQEPSSASANQHPVFANGLFHKDDYTDCCIIVDPEGAGCEFYAHMDIICARSPVFRDLFKNRNSDTATSKDFEMERLETRRNATEDGLRTASVHAEPSDFLAFLTVLYDSAKLSCYLGDLRRLGAIYNLSHEYKVQDLARESLALLSSGSINECNDAGLISPANVDLPS